jgi:hypothetical protein
MITAGWSELRRAFRQHARTAKNDDSTSHYLLLFYAVECGLKSVYLRRWHPPGGTMASISDERLRISHDLALWVKELRLPASIAGTNSNFRLKRDRSSWSVDKAHQAWRYGIVIEVQDEQSLVHWLHNIRTWVEENI